MANSGTVTAGSVALASQYNNLRADVLDASTSHTHSGAADAGAKIEGTALKSTGATAGHVLTAGAGGTTTTWSGVEGTAIKSTGATAGYVLTAGAGGTATTWAAAGGPKFISIANGSAVGTALGLTDGAYLITSMGATDIKLSANDGINKLKPGDSLRITALSEISHIGGSVGTTWAALQDAQMKGTDGYGIAWGNNMFLTAGNSSGTPFISTDGYNWNTSPGGFAVNGTMRSVDFGGGYFIVVSSANLLSTSPDGITWTARTSNFPGTASLMGAAYGTGIWFNYGEGGRVNTSTDLVTWSAATSTFGASMIRDAVFGGTLFVIVGDASKAATSPNGITWTSRTSAFTGQINKVAYGNGLYVAVGAGGTASSSSDGISWTLRTTTFTTAQDVKAIAYCDGSWVMAGIGRVAVSANGTAWSSATAPNTNKEPSDMAWSSEMKTLIIANQGASGTTTYYNVSNGGANVLFTPITYSSL
jgi:hypothetical protein